MDPSASRVDMDFLPTSLTCGFVRGYTRLIASTLRERRLRYGPKALNSRRNDIDIDHRPPDSIEMPHKLRGLWTSLGTNSICSHKMHDRVFTRSCIFVAEATRNTMQPYYVVVATLSMSHGLAIRAYTVPYFA